MAEVTMTDEQIESVVTEVLRRLLPGMGADGSRGPVLVVLTGATVHFTEAIRQLRGLILDGFELQLVFSEMAEHLYGSWLRSQLAGFPHWSHLTSFAWLRSLREAQAVVVPLMSVNALSKLALLIADNQAGNLILHGLFMGKPVIVAADGVEADQPDRAQLGFDKGLPALAHAVDERLRIIAGYGCQVVSVGQLSATVGAALPGQATGVKPGTENVVQNAEMERTLMRHEGSLLTAGDVRAAHSRRYDLLCGAKTLITPLARDLAETFGVSIVQDRSQEKARKQQC
ncbi:MAG: flavoprotein [Terracidiphilus sp.]